MATGNSSEYLSDCTKSRLFKTVRPIIGMFQTWHLN